MSLYRVKLTFKYSDTVHVNADNEEEAAAKALVNCEETFICFYDAEVVEEEE